MENKNITQRVNELLGTDYKGLIERVQWRDISACKYLTENFIREFKDYVDWEVISIYQKLSDGFMRKFKDKEEWHWTSRDQ